MAMHLKRAQTFLRQRGSLRASPFHSQRYDSGNLLGGGEMQPQCSPSRRVTLQEPLVVSSGEYVLHPPLWEGQGSDEDERGKVYTSWHDLAAIRSIFNNEIFILLVFLPLGYWAAYRNWRASAVFITNLIALIPLAALLGLFTEVKLLLSIACSMKMRWQELSASTGEVVGGLVNATFGNAVELILTVQSLRLGLLEVVKGTLLGSILSNLLLVLGTSFLANGLMYKEAVFNIQGATSNTTLLLLSSLSLYIPMIFQTQPHVREADVLTVSRISALVILCVYIMFLFFQLVTHIYLFQETTNNHPDEAAVLRKALQDGSNSETSHRSSTSGDSCRSTSVMTAATCIAFVTMLVAMNSKYIVDSIQIATEEWKIPQVFVGVVLLPIAGNAAEHWTAISVAMKNKMDLAIGVAAGSSTQIALFVLPTAVLLGWAMDQPMSLDFKSLETSIMFIAVLIVMAVCNDGRSNWLEGMMLISAYILVAIVFWYTPVDV